MSLKKIKQVKSNKWFRIWDLVVYGAIIAVVAVLFIVFTVKTDNSPLTGVALSYKGNRIYTYEFDDGKSAVAEGFDGFISVGEKQANGNFTVRFITEDGKGYNDVFIDVNERSAKVVESNCSTHKDCVYTQKLTSNGSVPIICTVHSLSVSPLKFEDGGIVIT